MIAISTCTLVHCVSRQNAAPRHARVNPKYPHTQFNRLTADLDWYKRKQWSIGPDSQLEEISIALLKPSRDSGPVCLTFTCSLSITKKLFALTASDWLEYYI